MEPPIITTEPAPLVPTPQSTPMQGLSKKTVNILLAVMITSIVCVAILTLLTIATSMSAIGIKGNTLILLSMIPVAIIGYCLGFLVPRRWYLSVLAYPYGLIFLLNIIFSYDNYNDILGFLGVSFLPLIFGYIGRVSRIKKEQNQTLESSSLNTNILAVALLVFIVGTLVYFDSTISAPEKYAKKDGEYINCGTNFSDGSNDEKNVQNDKCFSNSELKGCKKAYQIFNTSNKITKEAVTGQWEKGCLETTTMLKHTDFPEYVGKSYTCKVLIVDGGLGRASCSGELQDLMDANESRVNTILNY